jgi:hypothetical protein
VTEAVEIALIGAGAIVIPSLASIAAAIYGKRASERAAAAVERKVAAVDNKVVELDIKVDGRLTQLLRSANAQGHQDERDERKANGG